MKLVTRKTAQRLHKLFRDGCPVCEQRDEFRVIKETKELRTFEIWERTETTIEWSSSDDDWQEHIIFCPACEWEEEVK